MNEYFDFVVSNLYVKDYGNIYYTPCYSENIENVKNWPDITACSEIVSNKVEEIISQNDICLTLGGDHTIAIGTIHGHAKAVKYKQVAVIWIDAHGDINIPQHSLTGNAHGMPVSLITTEMRKYWPPMPEFEWHDITIPLRNFAYIGLRSLDPFEKYILRKYNIAAYGMDNVHKYGIDSIVKMALQQIDPDSNCSLHVSFDIDGIDSLEAPSTIVPGNV